MFKLFYSLCCVYRRTIKNAVNQKYDFIFETSFDEFASFDNGSINLLGKVIILENCVQF